MFMPWVWMFHRSKKQKPVPHIPTIRDMEGFSGFIKANRDAEVALEELTQTFDRSQYALYSKYREKVKYAMMLKPDSVNV